MYVIILILLGGDIERHYSFLYKLNHLLIFLTWVILTNIYLNYRVEKRLQQINYITINQTRHNYDGPGKTTVSFLNEDTDNGLIIDSYSQVN